MAQTVLYGTLETELARASADRDRLWIPLDDLERATGWRARPEGLCRDEVCVPVPAARQADWLDGERLDFAAFAAHLGHTVVRDEARGLWSFGPTVDRGAEAGAPPADVPDDVRDDLRPAFRLPDLDGTHHALSDYRGKKVLLYCWSSW